MTGTRESRVLRVASYRQRWIAATIDSALILPIVVIVDAVGSRFGARLSALLVLDLVIVSAYRIYFHGRYGQTIGKLIVGVRLALEDGEPIAWEHAWLRGAVELILMIAVCAAATGTLAALWVIPNEATAALHGAGFSRGYHRGLRPSPASAARGPATRRTVSLRHAAPHAGSVRCPAVLAVLQPVRHAPRNPIALGNK